MSQYNSGKYLEQEVQDYFDSLGSHKMVLHRFNDSAAARNLTKAQPADFLVKLKGVDAFLFECKSVKHEFRLPKFVQHPRMAKWRMAGTNGMLLVHHYTTDVYRYIDVSLLKLGAPSHDLRDFDKLTIEQAMSALFGV